jgi:hypothetical protein
MLLAAFVYTFGSCRGEMLPPPRAGRRGGKTARGRRRFIGWIMTDSDGNAREGCNPIQGCRRAYEHDRIGPMVFTGLYVLVNIGIMTEAALRWHALHKTILNREGGQILSLFGPMAKTFGQLLNFNCALLLLPVCRNLLKVFNLLLSKGGKCTAVLLRLIPLRCVYVRESGHCCVCVCVCVCVCGKKCTTL